MRPEVAKRTMRSVLPLAMVSVAVSLAAGCAGPTVAIHHRVPAALPVSQGTALAQFQNGAYRAGAITPPGEDVARAFAAALADQMARSPQVDGDLPLHTVGSPVRPVRVDGVYSLDISNVEGTRVVREMDPKTRQLTNRTLPTLTRKVAARVDFALTDADGRKLGTAEVRRRYDSLTDPDVLGPLGLQRPDDPMRVPDMGTIFRRLADECVDDLMDITRPMSVDLVIQTLPLGDPNGKAGLDAAAKGDYAAAVQPLQESARTKGDDKHRLAAAFDLAVCAEAAGQIPLARDQYAEAFKLLTTKDELYPTVADGLARTNRLIVIAEAMARLNAGRKP